MALGVVCIEEVCCDTCARDTGWLLPEEAGAAAGREGVAAAGADGAGDLLGAVEGVVLDGDACAVLPDEGLDELLELELLEDDLLPELPPRDIMRPPFQVESKSFLHP
ncbi:MAG: hypothetical protein H9533_21725 [Rhodobacteraceae bacterium]|nr:hypothetical protein [Paracoccaceae bacterium]